MNRSVLVRCPDCGWVTPHHRNIYGYECYWSKPHPKKERHP